jgi:hypothetical protein
MLKNSKIHPLLAFEHSGMFTDPESAYTLSMKYYEEQKKEQVEVVDDDPQPQEKKVDSEEV